MKKFKKLIPALAMLLVSASMLGTSTFAWFSMNTTVTATGMQIKAKSNNVFLLIGGESENTAALVQAQTGADLTTEALTVADVDSEVFPAAPILTARLAAGATPTAAEISANKYFASTHPVVSNASTAATVSNWFTAQNNNPASSNDSVKNAQELTAFTDYVIKKTVYLTLAVGSDNAHLLTVTPTIALKTGETASDITAVKVLVATGSNYVILDSTMTGSAQALTSTADFTITDQAAVQVDIYLYYDGEEAAVNTNDAADLAAATVDLEFGVTIGSAS